MATATWRERWKEWRVPALILFVVGLVALGAVRDGLSEQERRSIGIWCGLATHRPEEPYTWIAERRADHTVTIRFRFYERVVSEKDGVQAETWHTDENEEIGRWWIEDGVYYTTTAHAGMQLGLLDRFSFFAETGSWPSPHQFAEGYTVLRLDDEVFDYQSIGKGRSEGTKPVFHSVRGHGAAEFPDEPLPPEQWAKSAPSH